MRKILFWKITLPVLLILWSCTACSAPALAPPSPEELLSFVEHAFLCGFTVTEGDTSFAVTLERDTAGDTITVTAAHSRVTYTFANGVTALFCAGNEKEAARSIPVVLPTDRGAARWRNCFSLLPQETMTVERCAEGYRLLDTTENTVILFAHDGAPIAITAGDVTLSITSFTRTDQAS